MKKQSTAFYAELELVNDIRQYAAFNNIPFSDIVNTSLHIWYNQNISEVLTAIKKNKELEELISSYKNK